MEEKNKGIVLLPAHQIWSHPKNPRKDLGDLTELTASVKKDGILQNLTVVPRTAGGYTCVIGHRRLAAAKKAGLDTVPCRITEMTETEQLAMMLAENLQRADLTLYEQASGVQMMLDMGETVAGISKATGLSETTVRRREKLAQLPGRELFEACERGATLFDLEKLDKVEDEAERTRLLKAAGTRDFDNWYANTLSIQKSRKLADECALMLDLWARRIEQKDVVDGVAVPMDWYRGIYLRAVDDVPDCPDGRRKWFYQLDRERAYVYLYVRHEQRKDEDKTARRLEERRADIERRTEELREITARHYALRKAFVENFGSWKEHQGEIFELAFRAMALRQNGWRHDLLSKEQLGELIGAEWHKDTDEFDYQSLLRRTVDNPARLALLAAWWTMDGEESGYWRHAWSPEGGKIIYNGNRRIDELYGMLRRMGYQMSTEEDQLRLGKHDLLDAEDDDGMDS